MSTDPLDRYQSMMHDTHVPAHLPDQVLEQARAIRRIKEYNLFH